MFNVEEMNLMCIFNTDSRDALVADLRESLPDVYDPGNKADYQNPDL